MLAGVTSSEQSDYVEEMVARELPAENVLRLVCLMSHIQNGLKPKIYDLLKQEIIQVRFHLCVSSESWLY